MSAAHTLYVTIPEEPILSIVVGLFTILILVLFLPLVSKKVERNLEPFFFLMAIIAFGIVYSHGLVHDPLGLWIMALKSPVMISGVPIGIAQVVLIAGLVFYYFHVSIYRGIYGLLQRLGFMGFIAVFVALLGLSSSIISVIVAAVILSEILAGLPLPRKKLVELTVLASFALGMGAALTPVGEPLSTIAISKLSGPPYHAHFLFLVDVLGPYIVPGVIAIAIYAAYRVSRGLGKDKAAFARSLERVEYTETLRGVILRAIRVYLFVAALEVLGNSFLPLIEWYFTKIPAYVLYWVNMVSAILDNATLTAAEIGPTLSLSQIKSALIGLLISGGMLIPGNVPNIVAAGRLGITSKEWARVGVPFGIALLSIYFIALIPEYLK
ncbi:MAG: DUF1646 family protein [Pyrodictiaceae archaeon]